MLRFYLRKGGAGEKTTAKQDNKHHFDHYIYSKHEINYLYIYQIDRHWRLSIALGKNKRLSANAQATHEHEHGKIYGGRHSAPCAQAKPKLYAHAQ